MVENIENFIEKMLEFFPKTRKQYNETCFEMQRDYSERLDTVIVEDIFMPEVINLLRENKKKDMLHDLFEYFEKVSVNADEDLRNLFSITTLEILGNDVALLETAGEYMGAKTRHLQYEADKALGRDVSLPETDSLETIDARKIH